MHGFHGRILIVDLTERSFETRPLDDADLAATLGGKGLASRLLTEMNPAGCDPLGPENRLIFAAGPVTGGLIWGGSRYGVYTKSPLTGGYAESYAGGRVPEAVDAAGYDAVVIHGRADVPLALVVHPGGCEFVEAAGLWGFDTYAAEDEAVALARELFPNHPKRGACVIGPAAENLVRFSVIENDYWRSAGRGGAGTVMGAKKLKAVAFSGDSKRVPADPTGVAAYAKKFLKAARELPGVKAYQAQGTTQMVALMNTAGAFPAGYWTKGSCDHWEKLAGEAYHAQNQVKAHACAKCFMACGRLATIASGRHAGLTVEGPEYETIYAFGGLCMIEDMGEIAYLNDLCDRLGMDTISTGNLCAFAIEAVRRGKAEYPIGYGDAEGVAALVRDIAARRGLGSVLAEGIVPASRRLGLEEIAVHVKGMEPPGYDPRVLRGMGLSYAISDRGACHLRTTFYKPELAGMIAPDAVEGKAEMLADFEDRLTIFDTLILCRFYRDLYGWEELSKVVRLLTGLELDREGLREMAGRVRDTTRRFNLREGLGPEKDTLPGRFFKEPLPSGHVLPEEDFRRLLRDYYKARGWNEKGLPRETD